MTVTQQAAVHLGNDCLSFNQNQPQWTVTIVRCDKKVGQGSGRNPRNIRDRLARKCSEKDGFVDWLTGQFVYQQRKPTFSPIQYCEWAESVKFRKRMEGENRLVYEFILMLRIGSNRRGADGVRVKNFPGFTTLQLLAEIQNMMTEIQCELEQLPGRIIFMSMYKDIVRREKGNEELSIATFPNRTRICKKICARTLVVSWAWIRKEMVRNSHVQAEWKMGYRVAEDIDDQLHWKWTSRFPWIQCFGTRSFAKQRKRKHCLHISVVTTTQPKWFFAQSFPSISSVFTEQ